MHKKSRGLIVKIGILLLAGVVVVIGVRYVKWEILSSKFSHEFYPAIESDIQKGCLIDIPQYIKVLNYSSDTADVFMKSRSGNTWLMTFTKVNREWTHYDSTTGICHNEILNSEIGGSADQMFWYW